MRLFLFILMLTLSPLMAGAEGYESEDSDPAIEEEMVREDTSSDSEMDTLLTDEVSALGEERQEDTLYNEGEETEWNLEGEALPADDYE